MMTSVIVGVIFACCLVGGCKAIVGGQLSEEGDLPWMIRIQLGSLVHPFCGGALLEVNNKQFVLTVARCCHEATDMDTGILKPATAIAGDWNMTDDSVNKQKVRLNRGIWHPDFDFKNQQLCILGMDGRFNYTDYVKPITLPEQGYNATGDVVIGGWGYYQYNNWSLDYILRKVDLSLLSFEECLVTFDHAGYFIENHMRCAWDRNKPGAGSCVGDRGGPAVTLDGNYLIGIIQMQPFACEGRDRELPDVLLEVSRFVEWIEKISNDL